MRYGDLAHPLGGARYGDLAYSSLDDVFEGGPFEIPLQGVLTIGFAEGTYDSGAVVGDAFGIPLQASLSISFDTGTYSEFAPGVGMRYGNLAHPLGGMRYGNLQFGSADFVGEGFEIPLVGELSISFLEGEYHFETPIVGEAFSIPLTAVLDISFAEGEYRDIDFWPGGTIWSIPSLRAGISISFAEGTYTEHEEDVFTGSPFQVPLQAVLDISFAEGEYSFEGPVIGLPFSIPLAGVLGIGFAEGEYTPLDPPQGEITIISVTPFARRVRIGYGYDAEDAWWFEYRVDEGTPVNISTRNPFNVSGLDPQTAYGEGYIQMRAVNPAGSTEWVDVPAFETTEVTGGGMLLYRRRRRLH